MVARQSVVGGVRVGGFIRSWLGAAARGPRVGRRLLAALRRAHRVLGTKRDALALGLMSAFIAGGGPPAAAQMLQGSCAMTGAPCDVNIFGSTSLAFTPGLGAFASFPSDAGIVFNNPRRILGLAPGQNATDAVNVSQLTPAIAALGGTFNTVTGGVTIPTFAIAGSNYTNINAALTALTGGSPAAGVKYFHANSTGADSQPLGAESIAVGPGSTAFNGADLAMGVGATAGQLAASAGNNIALGVGAQATAAGGNTVAVGTGALAREANTVTLGANAGATNVLSPAPIGGSGSVYVGNSAGAGAISVAQAFAPATGNDGQNTYLGAFAGAAANGATNTFVGRGAGQNATGDANAFVGRDAGGGRNGSFNVALGSGAGQGGTAVDRSISVGSSANALASDSIAIGTGARANAAGDIALGTGASTAATVATAGATIAGKAYSFSGAVPTGALSVGGRQIQAVAAGALSASSMDAVNGSQLFATNQAIDGVSSTVNNITNGGGIKYFHANSMGADSTALGPDSIAVGPGAVAAGTRSLAFGAGTKDNGAADATVLGAGAAIGAGATGSNVALGANALAGRGAQTGYVGYGLAAPQASVGEVSVGAPGNLRQLTNVAAGSTGTDAANVGQLNAIAQNNATSLGGGAAYNATTGAFTAPSYVVGGTIFSNVGGAIANQNTIVGNLGGSTASTFGGSTIYDPKTGKLSGSTFTLLGNSYPDVTTAFAAVNNALNGSGTRYFHANSTTADSSATGADAIAVGTLAAASGDNSMAAGFTTTASGKMSSAFGASARATDVKTTAMGYNSYASGVSSSSFGSGATSAGLDSTAIGFNTVSSGAMSTALGAMTLASGDGSVAVGQSAQATSANAVSVGNGAIAKGGMAVSIGAGNIATGNGSVAIGDPSIATGLGAIAAGANNTAIGVGAVALGNGSLANAGGAELDKGAVAIGNGATASRPGDVAIGNGTVSGVVTPTGGVTIAGTAYAFAGATPVSAYSVGNVGNERQVQNVAAGALSATSTDAVNGSQLFATNQAVNSLSTNVTNITNGAGVKYFHANSTLADSSAGGMNSLAIGPAAMTAAGATNAVALGNGASANSAGSTALGAGAIATNANDVALGTGTISGAADGGWAGTTVAGVKIAGNALNANAVVSISGSGIARQVQGVADGAVTLTSTDAVNGSQLYQTIQAFNGSLGANVPLKADNANGLAAPTVTAGTNGLAVGYGASATAANSVALGNGATDGGRAKVVSVGSSSATRQVINVAGGTQATDAVNMGQLGPLVTALGGGATVNTTTGAVTGPSYNVGGVAYGNVGSALDATNRLAVQYTPDAAGNPTNQVTLSGANNGQPVKLSNVAPGTAPTDAVNLSQLSAVNSRVDGVALGLNALAGQVQQNKAEARRGTAVAAALANLPFGATPGRYSTAAAFANYRGETAIAGGVQYTADNSFLMKLRVTGSYVPGTNDFTFGGGAGVEF